MALGDVSLQYFRLPLSVSFNQYSILIVIYTISYRKDKRATPGKLAKNNGFRKSGRTGYKFTSIWFSSKGVKSLPCQKNFHCIDKRVPCIAGGLLTGVVQPWSHALCTGARPWSKRDAVTAEHDVTSNQISVKEQKGLRANGGGGTYRPCSP